MQAQSLTDSINAEAGGHLSITAPVLFGQLYVMPQVVKFLQRYPDVDVSAMFLERVVKYARRKC